MAHDDRTDVVAAVKADLERRGVNLSGPCGAFEITRRAAWQLRDSGAGLLSKREGNNCNGFAVDILCWRDGAYADVLIDAGNTNGPTWQLKPDLIDVSRWVAPWEPADPPAPAPTPDPPTPDPPSEPAPTEQLLHELLATVDGLVTAIEGLAHGVTELRDRLDNIGKSGVRIHL